MRELNECTAEVFRRSEKRIEERKKNRNHILVLCIPLCLIVTVCSVMILPGLMLTRNLKNAAQENMGEVEYSADENKIHPYVLVEVQNIGSSSEHYQKIDDTVQITELYSLICNLYETDSAEEGGADKVNDYEISGSSIISSYTIKFTSEDGSQTNYRLCGYCLANEATGETVYLNDSQLSELQKFLALTE